jgi:hypothetical protein
MSTILSMIRTVVDCYYCCRSSTMTICDSDDFSQQLLLFSNETFPVNEIDKNGDRWNIFFLIDFLIFLFWSLLCCFVTQLDANINCRRFRTTFRTVIFCVLNLLIGKFSYSSLSPLFTLHWMSRKRVDKVLRWGRGTERRKKNKRTRRRFARTIKKSFFSSSPLLRVEWGELNGGFANMGFLFKLNVIHKNYACVVIHIAKDEIWTWTTFKCH